MKPLLVLVGLLVAGAAGALGAALFAPAQNAAPAAAIEPAAAHPEVAGAAVPADVNRRMESLSMEVADLQAQIRELRSAAARTAVAAVEVAPQKAANAAVAVPAVQREQILQVIADAKAEEERRLKDERLKREEDAAVARADKMAQRFGLNEAQERQLVDFYAVSRTKLEEMRESMRTGGFDGEQMRTAMRDTRDWASSELERLFGPEIGKQIGEVEMDRFRGGFGGGGGPGGDGQGNRPARRGNGGGGNGNGGGGNGGVPGGPAGG